MAPKALKDVNAPKRPVSSYIAWQSKNRDAFVKKMPEGYAFGDLAKKFSAAWKEMSEAQKAPFEKAAKAGLEKYHKLMDKYKKTANYAKFQELKAQSKVDGVKKAKKFKKDENAPKRPPNGYFIFKDTKQGALVEGGMKFTEAMSKCGELWRALSEAEKKPFEDKAAAAKKKYEADVEKYHKTATYKKYMAEKAEFEASKKAELKEAKVSGTAEVKAVKKRSLSSSKSKSRSRSKAKKVKRSKSRSRSKAKKVKRSKSRSRSKNRKVKRSKSRSRSKAKKSARKSKRKSKSRSRSRSAKRKRN